MTYEQAVAIINEQAPGVIILTKGGKHVALQKTPGSVPFSITIPDASHLGGDPMELANRERESLLLSISAFAKSS